MMKNKMNQYEEKIKRISFISGEDFYFLTYLIMLCLKEFSNSKKKFSDHRKLAYLMQIIANPSAIPILIQNADRKELNPIDKEFLFDVYVKSSLHQREVYKILRTLEKKDLVTLIKTNNIESFNVEIKDEAAFGVFFETEVFDREIQSITVFKNHFKRISTLKLEGFISKFFENYGLKLWAN